MALGAPRRPGCPFMMREGPCFGHRRVTIYLAVAHGHERCRLVKTKREGVRVRGRGRTCSSQVHVADRQAAERLNISTASLYKLCAQNQVAHVRVGNTIRFNPADVSILVGVKRTTTVRATQDNQ